jgi:hypothetical protein
MLGLANMSGFGTWDPYVNRPLGGSHFVKYHKHVIEDFEHHLAVILGPIKHDHLDVQCYVFEDTFVHRSTPNHTHLDIVVQSR